MDLFSDLRRQFPNLEIYPRHPLAAYTTLKIGGPADIFVSPHTSTELINLLTFLSRNYSEVGNFLERSERESSSPKVASTNENSPTSRQPLLTILGNGSNVLISDSGIPGLVIKTSGNSMDINDQKVTFSAGTLLPWAISETLSAGLVGLENFAYIPATIGGAVYSNIHGFDKSNFSSLLDSIKYFDLNSNQIKNIPASNLNWSYDYSEFQDHPDWLILSATLKLSSGDTDAARQLTADIVAQKSIIQPMNSAGSVFKNPSTSICQPLWGEPKSAGWIIEHGLNLKNHRLGDAQIGPQHANIFTNQGSATATDFYRLIRLVQSRCQEKFGFTLDPEIRLLGKFE